MLTRVTLLLLVAISLVGQTSDRLLGTVKSTAPALVVASDKETVTVAAEATATVQKVAPGDRDLSKAQTVAISDLAVGDRVLLRGKRTNETFAATSIILMSAREIAQKNDREKEEWTRRGVAGLVEKVDAKTGEIVLMVRGAEGPKPTIVSTGAATSFKKYPNGSIRFADAADSSIGELKKGDQLRALGTKSEDGSRYSAERVVFGTFRSIAGEIVSVGEGVLEIKDAQTGKRLTLVLKPESQIKRFGGGMGPMGGMAGGPAGGGPRPGGPMGGPPGGGRPGGMPDLSQMIERLPTAALSDLKPGETVIASAALGQKEDQLNAVVVLGNAGLILQRLTAGAAGSSGARGAGNAGPGLGMSGGFGGLDGLMGSSILQ